MESVENGLISVWNILVNRHGLADKDERKSCETAFKQLEKTLEKSLLERIKHTEKRCVLLVGSNKDLIRKIACLIYYYSDTLGFYYVDCLNEKSIEDTLSRFKRGTIFLENLVSDLPLINRLDAKITDFLNTDSVFTYKFNGVKKVIPQGQLIASVSDTNNLPEYFTSQFDVIPLDELATQRETPQARHNITTLFYDDAKSIVFLEDGKHCYLTGDEQTLLDYLRNGEQHVDNIINHFHDTKEYSNTNWGRNNFDNLSCDLNQKTLKEIGVKLIENIEKGKGLYGILLKIKDKRFTK